MNVLKAMMCQRTHLSSAAVTLMALALASAGGAVGCAHGAKRARGPLVVYPPPPDIPRYQFLRSITKEEDIAGTSSFEKFLLGDKPEEQREFRKPYGAAMWKHRIYVTDTVAHRIVVLDFDEGAFESMSGDQGLGRVKVPINIFITPDGHKWVADTGREQVLEYDQNDQFVRALGEQGQFKPSDVAVRGNRIYVCDVRDHEIEVLDRRTGKRILRFGGPGSDPGKLSFPTNLALDAQGNLYVADTANFRIQKFSPEGKLLGGFGQVGDVPGTFSRPKGIAVDPEGRIYVVDAAFENIQVFDKDFRLLTILGGPGVDPGRFYLPSDVEIIDDNIDLFREYIDRRLEPAYLLLVVNQYGPHRINIFAFGQWQGEAPEEAVKPTAEKPPTPGVPSLESAPEGDKPEPNKEEEPPPSQPPSGGDEGGSDSGKSPQGAPPSAQPGA